MPVGPTIGTTHLCHGASRARVVDRDPIRGEHYGQRPCEVSHQKTGRMAVPTSGVKKDQNSLANRGPSTHGTKPKPAIWLVLRRKQTFGWQG